MFVQKDHPDLLVGLEVCDDAAVFRIDRNTAVIQTVDFFAPVVDDPYDYGAIAAANAMSDVYAMGGTVKLALNICAFPPKLPSEAVTRILQGGADRVREAGGVLAGGHTVEDREPKYGLSVLGIVAPDRIMTKAEARPGDLLILTKPIGVGVITTALKAGRADERHLRSATESMKALNGKASALLAQSGVRACTDVSGYAILGHGHEMAAKSGVRLVLFTAQIPRLPGAVEYARENLFPGGTSRNMSYYQPEVTFASGIEEEVKMLLYTPETSGGLLAAVPGGRLEEVLSLFARERQDAWVVGEVRAGRGIEVVR